MSGSAQEAYLRAGGPLAPILEHKYETGEMSREYVHRDYPRMAKVSLGIKTIDCSAQVVIPGRSETDTRTWTETREMFDYIVCQDEAEYERVMTGGMSAAQIEARRQEMINQLKGSGARVDPSWSYSRLEQELGQAPSKDAIAALQAKVADLEEKAELKRRIAELEARLAGRPAPVAQETSEDADSLRAQLQALGVRVDMRWGLQRLRDELEEATRPDQAA